MRSSQAGFCTDLVLHPGSVAHNPVTLDLLTKILFLHLKMGITPISISREDPVAISQS